MRVISNKILKEFYSKPAYKDAKAPLESWYKSTVKATWNSPADIKRVYKHVSIIANNRAVFNVAGNKYRLIAGINYPAKIVFVKFVGTHKQYDKADAATVELGD